MREYSTVVFDSKWRTV